MKNKVVLSIESVGAQAVGIARMQGKVVLVEGALSGELVEAEILQERKDYIRARTLKILEESPSRCQPLCKLYGKCGGCNLMHANYSAQIEIKSKVVRQQFVRIARFDPGLISVVESPPWGYRRRVRFQRVHSGGVGFLSRASNRVIPVQDCPILQNGLRQWIAGKGETSLGSWWQEVQILDNGRGDQSFALNGKVLDGGVEIALGEQSVFADAGVFFQSNAPIITSLIQRVVQSMGSTVNLAVELFSGVATFGSFMRSHCKKLVAVERQASCLAHARRNLGLKVGQNQNQNVQVVAEDAGLWLAKHRHKVDFLLVDPPREGLDDMARQAIVRCNPSTLVYISCNPATLARDSQALLAAGFVLLAIEGFDFYPQTDHLEVFTLWKSAPLSSIQ